MWVLTVVTELVSLTGSVFPLWHIFQIIYTPTNSLFSKYKICMLSTRCFEMPVNILECSLGLRLNYLDILVFLRLSSNLCLSKPEYDLVQMAQDDTTSDLVGPGTVQVSILPGENKHRLGLVSLALLGWFRYTEKPQYTVPCLAQLSIFIPKMPLTLTSRDTHLHPCTSWRLWWDSCSALSNQAGPALCQVMDYL